MPVNDIESLRGEFSEEIAAGNKRQTLGERILHNTTQPRILRPVIGGVAVAVAFTPGVVEGLAKGLPFKEAVVYGVIDSLLSVTRPSFDLAQISYNIRTAIPLFTTEIQAIITTSVTTATAVAGWQSFRKHSEARQKAILDGQAQINRSSEQMFLFGGEGSHVVNILTATSGTQALPIFENTSAAASILNRVDRGKSPFPTDKDHKPQVPVYVNLGVDGAIGYQNSTGWGKLKLNQGNLLRTKNGKRLLVTYGFGETKDEILPLKDELWQDLTVSELMAGTNQLKLLAERQGMKIDGIVRIYLGNARLKRQRYSGFGIKTLTDREAAAGVDIFVDTRAPLAAAIRDRLEGSKWVGFETSRLDYVDGLGEALANLGIKLYGEDQAVHAQGPTTALVHEDNISDTLELAEALRKGSPYTRVIALTPYFWAHERALVKGLESLCVPLIYARQILEIRQALREDKNPQQIQEELDQRFPIKQGDSSNA